MAEHSFIRGAKIKTPLTWRGDDAEEMILPKRPVCYSSEGSEYREWLIRQTEQMEHLQSEMMKKHPGIAFSWKERYESGVDENGNNYYKCVFELVPDRPVED